jgi:hypothetical protein
VFGVQRNSGVSLGRSVNYAIVVAYSTIPRRRDPHEGEEEVGAIGRRAIGMVVRGLPSFRTRCSEAGPTADCLELSGRFRIVTISCGCASRAPGIQLIKAPISRVYTESSRRSTILPNYGILHYRARQGSAYT